MINVGYVVEKGNTQELFEAIKKCKQNNFLLEDCIERSLSYDKKKKYEEYINLYKKVMG